MKSHRWLNCVLLAGLANSGCVGRESDGTYFQAPAEDAWFEDATSVSGIDFRHVRATVPRFWLPEIMSGGVACIDFDRDGDWDLYFVQGGELDPGADAGPGNRLYENVGEGKFQDVTERAGVGDATYGMGVAVGDYDGDGLEDLYVTNVGPNVLYRNQGNGTFAETAAVAGVDDSAWGTSAVFADYDADGHLDLFVANYLHWSPQDEVECRYGNNQRDYCAPSAYDSPLVDRLYRNLGDGRFADVSEQVGLTSAAGNGLGVVAADFDQDGRLDFYVANDGNPNQLWLQEHPGRFVDRALAKGCAVNGRGTPEAGMGAAAVDLDHDGDLDLFMTHLVNESNTLYVNQQGTFQDATARHGLAASSLQCTGFGLGFHDFDQDGSLDLFVANGRVTHVLEPMSAADPFAEPNQIYRGTPQGRFQEIAPHESGAAASIATSRGVAFADFNRDGRVDLVVANNGSAPQLLLNRGKTGHSLQIQVLDEQGRLSLGARVGIQSEGKTLWRMVQRGYSYLSSNSPIVHFGLGEKSRIEQAMVVWPDRTTEVFPVAMGGQLNTLRRGYGRSGE